MKNKFTLFIVFLISLSALLIPATPLIAQDTLADSIKKGGLNDAKNVYNPNDDINTESLSLTIARLIRSVIAFIGVILIVLITYAGFMWMTSRGNEDQVSKAKKIMSTAIIGTLIILSAYMISSFVIDHLLIATTGTGIEGQ